MVSAEELRKITTQAINNDPLTKIIQYVIDSTDILVKAAEHGEFSTSIVLTKTEEGIKCNADIDESLLNLPSKYFNTELDAEFRAYNGICVTVGACYWSSHGNSCHLYITFSWE